MTQSTKHLRLLVNGYLNQWHDDDIYSHHVFHKYLKDAYFHLKDQGVDVVDVPKEFRETIKRK